jgi:hypothetical protein
MNNPTPREPLINETPIPESVRVVSDGAVAYRMVRRKEVIYDSVTGFQQVGLSLPTLQGAYKIWHAQGMIEFEWRDIPTVEL